MRVAANSSESKNDSRSNSARARPWLKMRCSASSDGGTSNNVVIPWSIHPIFLTLVKRLRRGQTRNDLVTPVRVSLAKPFAGSCGIISDLHSYIPNF